MTETSTGAAGRGLQILGGLALCAWTLGGLVAWKATADGVHVTLADGADTPEGPDPLALLGDQVGEFRADLSGLTATLSENLGLLAEDFDARAGAQGALLEALAADLAAVRTSVAAPGGGADEGALDARLARVEGLLREVLAAREDAAERERMTAEFAAVEAARAEARAEAEARRADALARLERERAEAAVEPAGKRSFLAFQLPSDDFRFDERQRFRIVTNLSRVGFDAKSTLHDFTGVSERAAGQLVVNLAKPGEGITGEFTVPSASLDTALEGRDEAMRKVLGVEAFPSLRFELTGFEATAVDEEAQSVAGTVNGHLTIHGTTRAVAMPLRGEIDESRRLRVGGETTLAMSSFGLEPPSKLGMIKVEDEVRIWVSLCLRPSPLAEEAGTKREED